MEKGNTSRPRVLCVSKRDAGLPLVQQSSAIDGKHADSRIRESHSFQAAIWEPPVDDRTSTHVLQAIHRNDLWKQIFRGRHDGGSLGMEHT